MPISALCGSAENAACILIALLIMVWRIEMQRQTKSLKKAFLHSEFKHRPNSL